jgi:hypothetical protein
MLELVALPNWWRSNSPSDWRSSPTTIGVQYVSLPISDNPAIVFGKPKTRIEGSVLAVGDFLEL